jgi:hypothetical protein
MLTSRSRRGAPGGIGSNGARRAPDAAAGGGNLGALAATLSGLGVQLDRQRARPDALKPSVADIAAGINRTVSALARIATQLGDGSGQQAGGGGAGGRGSAAMAPGVASPQERLATASSSGGSGQGPDAARGSAPDRTAAPRRSPLKGASQQQLLQLRRELDRLNDTVLRARRSGGVVPAREAKGAASQTTDAAAAPAARGAAGAAATAVGASSAAASPGASLGSAAGGAAAAPGGWVLGEQEQQQPQQQRQPENRQPPAPAEPEDCAAAVSDAARQLARLQAENRELRSHLGAAEMAASDLRQQLVGLQLAIDRNGGVDAGQLLLENQKLTRLLHAKEQAVAAAHAALVAQSAQSSDERAAELRGRLQEAAAQLRARDAALAAAEAQLRGLRTGRDQRRAAAAGPAAALAAGFGPGMLSDASLTSPDDSETDAPAGGGGRDSGDGDDGGAAPAADVLWHVRAALEREQARSAELEAALEERAAEAAAAVADAGALREQVAALLQQQQQQQQQQRRQHALLGASGDSSCAAAVTPAGLPTLNEALQALARHAQEVAEMRADAARCEERHGEALAAQEVTFERRLGVQQRLLEAAQAEVRRARKRGRGRGGVVRVLSGGLDLNRGCGCLNLESRPAARGRPWMLTNATPCRSCASAPTRWPRCASA